MSKIANSINANFIATRSTRAWMEHKEFIDSCIGRARDHHIGAKTECELARLDGYESALRTADLTHPGRGSQFAAALAYLRQQRADFIEQTLGRARHKRR